MPEHGQRGIKRKLQGPEFLLHVVSDNLVFFTPKTLKGDRPSGGLLLIANPQFKAFPFEGSAKNFHLVCDEEGTFSPPQTPPLADCL